jgi:hypothetical protein
MIVSFCIAFAKLRTANSSFVMFIFPPIRPPARPPAWNNSVSTGRIFMTFDDFGVLENLLRKFKDDKNVARVTLLHMKTCLHL